jgi:hypothetical protein
LLAASIQLTLALEILLVCCEGTIPATRKLLPLGKTHLAQLGLLLGLAVFGVEFADVRMLSRISFRACRRSLQSRKPRNTERLCVSGRHPHGRRRLRLRAPLVPRSLGVGGWRIAHCPGIALRRRGHAIHSALNFCTENPQRFQCSDFGAPFMNFARCAAAEHSPRSFGARRRIATGSRAAISTIDSHFIKKYP